MTNLLGRIESGEEIPDCEIDRLVADPRSGSEIICQAVVAGNRETLRKLCRAGLAVNQQTATGNTPLCAAAHVLDKESVQILLEYGAIIDFAAGNGVRPIFYALGSEWDLFVSDEGYSDRLVLCSGVLFEKGACPDRLASEKESPLEFAVRIKHPKYLTSALPTDTRSS